MINAQKQKMTVLLAAASQTNSATRTANLDCIDADYVCIEMNFASAINTNAVGPNVSLKESDDTTATNFATFNSNFNLTGMSIAAAHGVRWEVDTRARKRYLQLGCTTATATNDNVTMGAVAFTSRLGNAPSNTAAAVGSTNDIYSIG